MSNAFDYQGIHKMIVALGREMMPRNGRQDADAGTLFLGGPLPAEAEERGLAEFALAKNYNIIFMSFDRAGAHAGPIALHVVMTDGVTQAATLPNARLWKRARNSPVLLLLPDLQATIRLNAKGGLVTSDMNGRYHDGGYDLAREAVISRAAQEIGGAPVVFSVKSLPMVMDIGALADTFAVAA